MSKDKLAASVFGIATTLLATSAHGQAIVWDNFIDPVTGGSCDVVNAISSDDFGTILGVEIVVISTSGEFLAISGQDTLLPDIFADENLDVFFFGIPFGRLSFAQDGDGFASVWWISALGTVIHVDSVTLTPSLTNFFPSEFSNVLCDACESVSLLDEPIDCDADLDGVENDFDLCPGTPFGEFVDADGCSCEEFDDDQDGVDNCDDFCPGTPFQVLVANDGCPVDQSDGGSTTVIVNFCGAGAGMSMALTAMGLGVMGARRRRTFETF